MKALAVTMVTIMVQIGVLSKDQRRGMRQDEAIHVLKSSMWGVNLDKAFGQ